MIDRRARKAQLLTWFIVIVTLLPFIQYFGSGVTALAEENGSQETELFKNEAGSGKISHREAGDKVDWTISYDKQASELGRQLGFILKEEDKVITPKEVSSDPADLFSVSQTADANEPILLQTKVTTANEQITLRFQTEKITKLSVQTLLNEFKADGSQENLLAAIPAVDISTTTAATSATQTTTNSTTDSTTAEKTTITSTSDPVAKEATQATTSTEAKEATVKSTAASEAVQQSKVEETTGSTSQSAEASKETSAAKEEAQVTKETAATQTTASTKEAINEATKEATKETTKETAPSAETKAEKRIARAPVAAKKAMAKAPAAQQGKNITAYDTANEMNQSPDGKTIMDNAQFYQGNPPTPITDKSEIKISNDKDTELALSYNWSIPENVRQQIQPGDYFEFDLPGNVKIKPGSNSDGELTDGTTIFGTYNISDNGKVRFTFNENLKKGSNARGLFGLKMLVDKDSFGQPGKIEMKIPFTDESNTVTPDTTIPNNQNLSKEVVDEGTTKDEEIKNNQATVKWQLSVNKMGYKMTDATVVDTLPKGVTYKPGSYKVTMYEVNDDRNSFGDGIDATKAVKLQTDGQKMTFMMPNDSSGKGNGKYAYVITFDTTVDFNEPSLNPKAPGWAQTPVAKVKNTAVLNSNEAKNIPADSTKTFASKTKIEKEQIKENDQSYQPVKPTVANNFSNGVFQWRVKIDKQGLDLVPGTVMNDTMTNGQELTDENGVPFDLDEIQALVDKSMHTGGKNTGKTVKVTSNVVDGKNNYIFTFPEGLSDGFVLDYHSNMKGQVGVKYSNTFTWNNKGESAGNDYQPIESKGIKDFKKDADGKPVGLDKGQVTWEIKVNTNTKKLDSWYVQDYLTGPNSKLSSADSFKVYEVDSNGQERLLTRSVAGTKGDYTVDEKDGTYTIKYPNETSSSFVVRYTSSYDKDSNDYVKNAYEYHYIKDGKDWHTEGESNFQPKPVELGNITGSKKGDYYYDTKDQKDKVRWTVTINDNKTKIGSNAVFSDPIPEGQELDTSIEPEVFDENGNKLDTSKSWNLNLKKGPSWSYVEPKSNRWYGKFLNISAGSNENGTLVVGALPEDNQKYTIKFVTKLKTPADPDNIKETVTNVANYRDDSNEAIELEGKTSFKRNSHMINKTHKANPLDSSGKQTVDYSVIVNQGKEMLRNVVVEDSNWENITIDGDSVKVVDSNGKALVEDKDYTIDKTGQQLFIRFKGTINDTYTVTYSGNVVWNGLVGQSINVKNSAKISGDGIEEKTVPVTDGWKAKIPDSVATVIVENGSLTVTKVDSKDPNKKLANATFDLVKAETDDQGQVVYGADGKAKIKEKVWKDVVTDDQGLAEFTGLVTDKYFLIETNSPDNYYISNELKEHRNDGGKIDPGKLIEINVDNKASQDVAYTIENPMLPISGEKTWADDDDKAGKRPDNITVHLMRDDQTKPVQTKTVKVDQDGKWRYEFVGIPKYDNKGNEIKYSVKEEPVKNYYTYYNGTSIVNTILTDVPFVKVWDDSDNNDKSRPKEITIYLNKEVTDEKGNKQLVPIVDTDNKPVSKKVSNDKVSAKDSNKWIDATGFTSVPKYDRDGKEIKYVVTEDAIKGYNGKSDYVMDNELNKKVVQATNFNPPATVELKGKKTWNDGDAKDRPNEIKVQVMRKLPNSTQWEKAKILGSKAEHYAEKDVDPQTVKGTDWTYSFKNLPKYKDGQLVEYSVQEVKEKGYISKVGDTSANDPDPSFYIVNITNTKTMDVEGEKMWDDEDDQDGLRPTSIEVQLYRKEKGSSDEAKAVGKAQKVESNKDGKWKYEFKDLPQFSENGQEYDYRVKEVAVPDGYTEKVTGTTITNTHEPATIQLKGKKIWDDKDNQDGKRPKEVTIQLMERLPDEKDATPVKNQKAATINGSDWTYEFKDLPKYRDGQPIIYSINETSDLPDGYVATSPAVQGEDSEQFDLTNSYTPETTRLIGKKVWVDGNNAETKRPEIIKVQLMKTVGDKKDAKPEEVAGQSQDIKADADGNWQYNFTDLDKYENGQFVHYSVKEVDVPDGYVSKVSKDSKEVTNTYTTELKGKKTWHDGNSTNRPKEIKVQLLADGKVVPEKVATVTEQEGWEYAFTDLAKYDKDSKKMIQYSVKEVDVPKEYVSEVSKDSKEITNTYTTELKGKKIWHDGKAADRPKEIKVQLMKTVESENGEKSSAAVKDSAGKDITRTVTDKDWSYEFTNLPKFDQNDKEIHYTVKEIDTPNGYRSEVKDNNIVNTKLTEVEGKKVWDDANNQDGKRPEEITVQLLQKVEGEKDTKAAVIKEIQVTAKDETKADSNVWAYRFKDLPQYTEAGKLITYSVKEKEVSNGYKAAIDGQTITNTYEPETTKVAGKKIWDDQDDQAKKRPKTIKVQLLKQVAGDEDTSDATTIDGKEIKPKEVTATNDWHYEFTNLPKYEDGKAITYSVKEVVVPAGYESTVDGFDIKNTYEPSSTDESIELEGEKVWKDNDDQDKIRPTEITVILKQNGKVIAETNATAENNWQYSFTDLEKTDENGKAYRYTVAEKTIPVGYVATVNGTTITNTHVPNDPEEPNDPGKPNEPGKPNIPGTPDVPHVSSVTVPTIPNAVVPTVATSTPEATQIPAVSIPTVATHTPTAYPATATPTTSEMVQTPQAAPQSEATNGKKYPVASGKAYPQTNDKNHPVWILIGFIMMGITSLIWYRRKIAE